MDEIQTQLQDENNPDSAATAKMYGGVTIGKTETSTEEQLKYTQQQLLKTKTELYKNQKELLTVRQQSTKVQQEIQAFHQDRDSQHALMRNKDKELERLRLIIADRTLQLTEKTGQLSITKVALVSSENDLTDANKQLQSRYVFTIAGIFLSSMLLHGINSC